MKKKFFENFKCFYPGAKNASINNIMQNDLCVANFK